MEVLQANLSQVLTGTVDSKGGVDTSKLITIGRVESQEERKG